MYKLMLLGEPGTGKSCFLSYITRYTNVSQRTQNVPKIEQNHYPTVGLEVGVHTVELSQSQFVNLQIWDTTGDHAYHKICDKYYNDVNTYVIFVDYTDRKSLVQVSYWLTKIRQNRSKREGYSIFGIANKSQVADRQFNGTEFQQMFLKQIQLTGFSEISLKTGVNVHRTILDIARLACNNVPNKIPHVEGELKDMYNEKKQPVCQCILM